MDKKISPILFFLILGYIFFQFNSQVSALTVSNKITNIINETVNKLPITFSDTDYQNPTTKFNNNSDLYLKFSSSANGSEFQEAWLLNSNKEKIQPILLTRTGNGPYIYEGTINLPYKNGLYYLSIKLQGKGNSFAFEQNIDVIAGNSTPELKITPTIVYPENKQEKGVKSILFNILSAIVSLVGYLFKKGA